MLGLCKGEAGSVRGGLEFRGVSTTGKALIRRLGCEELRVVSNIGVVGRGGCILGIS